MNGFACHLITNTMDPETGCGLPSTGQKVRLLIGTACWFWNFTRQILAAVVRLLAWSVRSVWDQAAKSDWTLSSFV